MKITLIKTEPQSPAPERQTIQVELTADDVAAAIREAIYRAQPNIATQVGGLTGQNLAVQYHSMLPKSEPVTVTLVGPLCAPDSPFTADTQAMLADIFKAVHKPLN